LWRIELVFHVKNKECMTRVGYKGLPQGSVLSPFLYSLLGSGLDRFILSGCVALQYADDVVIYASHRIFEMARALVQTACTALSVFSGSIGLTISSSKSKLMLFSRKHMQPPVNLWLDGNCLLVPTTDGLI
jgi:Reverse transcriptase (RNA-dependent DNA polymerase)